MTELSIVRLRERPECLQIVAQWIDAEWGAFSGRSPQQTYDRFAQELHPGGVPADSLPISLLALDDGEPVGVATLRERDSVDWDCMVAPWICNVYVRDTARGKGVAGQLCENLQALAARLGYAQIYLATSMAQDSLYHRLGYLEYKRSDNEHHRLHLLRRRLESNAKVACIGSGVIGSAWAAWFASQGLQVSVYDPNPLAEQTLHASVQRAAVALGQAADALLERLSFTTDLGAALAGAAFVQESGPESLDLKQQLYAQLDGLLPPSVVIASSTSELPISAIQRRCAYPERTVVGHPINPPYALALVEVVAGGHTSTATLDRTCAFYRSVGRMPLRLEHEAPGFVANRLQIALLRTALQMVAKGEATVAQVDSALMHGIGARWAAVGMFGAFLLNLPDADVDAWLAHFERIRCGEALVDSEPFPQWTPELRSLIAQQWAARVGDSGADVLLRQRDAFAVALGRWRSTINQ